MDRLTANELSRIRLFRKQKCKKMKHDKAVYFDRKAREFIGIDAIKPELQRAYKGIDVEAELAKMKIWLLSPRGKNRKGTIGFIANWLNNASTSTVFKEPVEVDSALIDLLEDYRKGLWKNCEHLL